MSSFQEVEASGAVFRRPGWSFKGPKVVFQGPSRREATKRWFVRRDSLWAWNDPTVRFTLLSQTHYCYNTDSYSVLCCIMLVILHDFNQNLVCSFRASGLSLCLFCDSESNSNFLHVSLCESLSWSWLMLTLSGPARWAGPHACHMSSCFPSTTSGDANSRGWTVDTNQLLNVSKNLLNQWTLGWIQLLWCSRAVADCSDGHWGSWEL